MKQADIEIRGIHALEMNSDTVVTKVKGTYQKNKEAHYIMYEEQDADDGKITRTRMKFDNNVFEICRKGQINSSMRFEKGKETKTNYVTNYGTFALSFDTKEMSFVETADRICIELSYVLYVDSVETSGCDMSIVVNVIDK